MDTMRAPPTLDDVRLVIFRQHTQIAQLTDELESHAVAVVAVVVTDGDPHVRANALNEALDRFNAQFVRHLDFEESHLGRWLPPRGAERDSDEALLRDHADLRTRLKGLLHDRDVFDDQRTVAREALAFVHQLRRDMAAEDSTVRGLR